MIKPIESRRDPRLAAAVRSRTPLLYTHGADPTLDRAPHVRAGSSVTRFGDRLAVVQDDALFVALIDPDRGMAEAIALPAGHGGLRQFDDERGNKRFKPDLEACTTVPTAAGNVLLAFGSGSSERRESIMQLTPSRRVQLIAAKSLYRRLREASAFAGSELNVEGAVFMDGRIRLFNRGNGAPQNGMAPVNATCDLTWAELAAYLVDPVASPVPELRNIRQYELGEVEGGRLSFTDGALTDYGLLYTASAEDSPDARSDGRVTGSAIGLMHDTHGCRWIELRNADGSLFTDKIEGICAGRQAGQVYTVVDADDAARPSEMCVVELSGFR